MHSFIQVLLYISQPRKGELLPIPEIFLGTLLKRNRSLSNQICSSGW